MICDDVMSCERTEEDFLYYKRTRCMIEQKKVRTMKSFVLISGQVQELIPGEHDFCIVTAFI